MEPHTDHPSLSILLDVMKIADEADSPQALAQQALERLLAHDAITAGAIWMCDGDRLICLAQRGFTDAPSMAQIHRVATNGVPVFLEVPQPSAGEATQDARALAIVPLAIKQESVGALALLDGGTDHTSERMLYRAIAAHMALALERMRAAPLIARPVTSEHDWDEFLAHVAHEIKNPLASIKGYADLLGRRAAKDPADPYRKGLTIISQQVARTTGLLDQLSDMARIGTNRMRLAQRDCDVATLVRQVVAECQEATDQHQLTLDGVEQPLPAYCDEMRVRQIVGMMLDNAIKFSPYGGPVIMRVWRSDDGEQAVIAVSDHGIGVPEGEHEQVFERFFRGSNASGSYRGMGVGLFIARAIIERHGGRMWLESAPDAGTTCFATLPLRASS